MTYIRNNKGFTLIELLISIGIIAIAIGMTSFGIGIIFDTKIDSYARQYQNDLRDIKSRTLSTLDEQYQLFWQYDASTGYYYEIWNINPLTFIKRVDLNKSVVVYFDSPTADEITLPTVDATLESMAIVFDKADGSVLSSSGHGIYTFTSSTTTDEYRVEIIKATGGIFLEK